MQNKDILFREEDGVFSYRVAGVLIRDKKILLHRFEEDPGYAFPGGHVNYGEESAQGLIREFKEEINADILPVRLLWVGENFFPWDRRLCHQLCLYYQVQLQNAGQLPQGDEFLAMEQLDGQQFRLKYSWVPLDDLDAISIYPTNAKAFLQNPSQEVRHFVYHQ